MNTQSNAVPESPLDMQGMTPAVVSATRPMYWSVRRELWENRSIYIAPLAAAAIAMLGFLISLYWLPRDMRALPPLDPAHQCVALATPYSHVAMVLMLTGVLVGIFYCLDALHGERRDRSILFWKSLPVSDLTTVLSKSIIPLAVLPVIPFAIIVATQLVMLLWTSVLLITHGMSPGSTWTNFNLFQQSFILLYGL